MKGSIERIMENTNISGTTPALTPHVFTVTDSAAARIAQLLADEPPGTAFRVSIMGGGCSGFSYVFDLDSRPAAETDLLIERHGARVAIDDVSLGLLSGSALDYTEDLSGAGFQIKNPNATAKCGCGNSFGIG
jgi:iron-sulfur cluster assembly accessory protein